MQTVQVQFRFLSIYVFVLTFLTFQGCRPYRYIDSENALHRKAVAPEKASDRNLTFSYLKLLQNIVVFDPMLVSRTIKKFYFVGCLHQKFDGQLGARTKSKNAQREGQRPGGLSVAVNLLKLQDFPFCHIMRIL